jgi:hypothetical protein
MTVLTGIAAAASALLLAAGTVIPGTVEVPGSQETEAGVMSANVEHIMTVPLEQGTATGAHVIDDILYMTSWRSMSIYDVSDPLAPVLLSRTPLGFRFQNENVSTNGKILLISEQAPVDRLHVWDVSDPENPTELSSLLLAGTHTATCILDCSWSYGSYDFVGPQGPLTGGQLVDLADPANPVDAGHYNHDLPATQTHDVTEVRPGRVLTASAPLQLLDVREDPANPKLLAVGTNDDKRMHTARWPRNARDRFILTTFETNGNPRCTEQSGEFTTWNAHKWWRTGVFEPIDEYRVASGTYLDGSPAVNQLGCSAHWFEEHPTFRNGGLVAAGFYEHGVRFLDVDRQGKISEVGYFMGWGGSTSAAYWLTDEIVYSIDYSRGIDILRFDRTAPTGTTADVDPSAWELLGAVATGARADGFVCRLNA